MSAVRLQGRPRRGPLAVGRDRIIEDTLELLRRGETFSTRKELAAKIGITPALINYYFGSKCDLISEPISRLIEHYAEQFRQCISRYQQGFQAELVEALAVIVRMYARDRPLVARYAHLVATGMLPDCAIERMKDDLAAVFVGADEQATLPDGMGAMLTAMVWGACSAAKGEVSIGMCVSLVDRLIAALDDFRCEGDEDAAIAPASLFSRHDCESISG